MSPACRPADVLSLPVAWGTALRRACRIGRQRWLVGGRCAHTSAVAARTGAVCIERGAQTLVAGRESVAAFVGSRAGPAVGTVRGIDTTRRRWDGTAGRLDRRRPSLTRRHSRRTQVQSHRSRGIFLPKKGGITKIALPPSPPCPSLGRRPHGVAAGADGSVQVFCPCWSGGGQTQR